MLMLLCNIVTSNQHQGINVILSIICLILILFYLTRCYYTRYCRECNYSDYKSYCNSYPKHMYISFHKIKNLVWDFGSAPKLSVSKADVLLIILIPNIFILILNFITYLSFDYIYIILDNFMFVKRI